MRYLFILLLFNVLSFAQQPDWVKDPSLHGKYVGAVGCAKEMQNKKLQEKIAILRAKGAISREIDVSIYSSIHMKQTLDNNISSEDFGFESNQNSLTTFTIKVMDSYFDKKKNLCVWVVKK